MLAKVHVALVLLAAQCAAFAPVAGRRLAAMPTASSAPVAARDVSRHVMLPDSVVTQVAIGGTVNFLGLYNLIITARVLLSWFPQSQGVAILQPIFIVTEPFLRLFRGLIPPIGGIDLSLIIALFGLQYFSSSIAALGADPSMLL